MTDHSAPADYRVDPEPLMRGEANPEGPVIPIVVSLTFPGMDKGLHGLMCTFTQTAFDAVRAAGGQPRLVDSADGGTADGAAALDGADGVLFLGGGDVDGEVFGVTGSTPANSYGVDRLADDYCLGLIREAVDRDLPTLAICRGSQLLNVAFGGTIVADLDPWELHRGGPGEPAFLDEEVLLETGSIIADILGRTKLTVRSGHHQAVDQVGEQLWVTARAHDGIVEGTQHRDASWVIGVQWHPEEPDANLDDRERVFRALVEQAAGESR